MTDACPGADGHQRQEQARRAASLRSLGPCDTPAAQYIPLAAGPPRCQGNRRRHGPETERRCRRQVLRIGGRNAGAGIKIRICIKDTLLLEQHRDKEVIDERRLIETTFPANPAARENPADAAPNTHNFLSNSVHFSLLANRTAGIRANLRACRHRSGVRRDAALGKTVLRPANSAAAHWPAISSPVPRPICSPASGIRSSVPRRRPEGSATSCRCCA